MSFTEKLLTTGVALTIAVGVLTLALSVVGPEPPKLHAPITRKRKCYERFMSVLGGTFVTLFLTTMGIGLYQALDGIWSS